MKKIFGGFNLTWKKLIIFAICSGVYTVVMAMLPAVQNTSSDECHFDDTYKAYLVDKKYGDVNIHYDESLEAYMVHADFKHGGETELVIEGINGKIKKYSLNIGMNSYKLEQIK